MPRRPTPATPPPDPSWRAFEEWGEAARAEAGQAEKVLAGLIERWKAWLEPFGEISEQDWRQFRPLRLSREEAWTDWLAHLIEQSRSGAFARLLLCRDPRVCKVTALDRFRVAREVPSLGGERRADIIVEWEDAVAHIEVKVGDQAFEKTFHTARLLEQELGKGRTWVDFILLPPQDVEVWRSAAKKTHEPRSVCVVTWADVAGALRGALRRRDEYQHQWRAWAHSFCGAIEQKLLGCEPLPSREAADSAIRRLMCARVQIDAMKRGEE